MADLPSPDDPALAPLGHPRRGLKERLRAFDPGPTHALMAVLAIATLVVAVWIGRSLADVDGGTSSEVSGDIALSDWVVFKRAPVPPVVKAMLPGAEAVKPLGIAGVTVITGDIAANGVPALLSGLRLDEIERRQLGAGRARANVYTAPLAEQPTVTATMLMLPTSAGVKVAACLANVSDSGLKGNDCLTVLTTHLQMQGTTLAADRLDKAQISKFTELFAAFGAARQRDSTALAKAQTSGPQARAASRLSDGYTAVAGVASDISYSTLTSASGQALTEALTDGAAAYEAMAQAAERRAAAAFRTARADVIAANTRIDAALSQLGALGYAGS